MLSGAGTPYKLPAPDTQCRVREPGRVDSKVVRQAAGREVGGPLPDRIDVVQDLPVHPNCGARATWQ